MVVKRSPHANSFNRDNRDRIPRGYAFRARCIARENDASDAMPSRFVKDHSMLIVK